MVDVHFNFKTKEELIIFLATKWNDEVPLSIEKLKSYHVTYTIGQKMNDMFKLIPKDIENIQQALFTAMTDAKKYDKDVEYQTLNETATRFRQQTFKVRT